MDALSVLMNEVQSLKKEILSLREQNISLYNELARQHAILNDNINFANSQNLRKYVNHLVGMQTAELIADNMSKVKSFDTREAHLKYALSQAGNDAVGGGYIWNSVSSRATA